MKLRAISNLYVVLLLSVFTTTVCSSQTLLQKNHNGLTTITFNSSKGEISIYIPAHNENEHITVSISIVADGNSRNKIKKNSNTLEQFQLTYGGIPISLQSKNYYLNTAELKNNVLSLSNEKGTFLASSKIIFPSQNKTSITTAQIPPYMTAGQSGKISTSLDGISSNTSVSINNENVAILAESETNLFFEVPSNIRGISQLQVQNDGQTIEEEVNVLALEISVERLNLMRGETTSLLIQVSGLEGLQTEVPITITNESPTNISLEGGNNQEITIQPNGDIYELSQTITATQGGSFSVSATILPSNEFNVLPNNEPLCNCIIDDYSYLISPESCEELGGHCSSSEHDMPLSNIQNLENDGTSEFTFRIKQLSIDNDIKDLEDSIDDKWEKWHRAKHLKDSLSELHIDLVTIDSVLDRIPEAYKDKLKKAIDSLVKANEQISEEVTNAALENAIADAQANLEACKNRVSQIEATQEQQEKDLESLEEEMNTLLDDLNKVLDDYCIDNSCKASFTKKADGTFSLNYDIPKETDGVTREYISEFTSAIYKITAKHRRALKTHKQTLENLEDAKEDCSELEDALRKAEDAKAKSDYKAALELKVEDECDVS
ncbi:hypothetical protein A9Q87_04230 [Flavobacteriales bacterium 34_180_T64]|nr:hypothetical protein A9Q87_04230 [Flavobacteriales bacterium 34_180_T64]